MAVCVFCKSNVSKRELVGETYVKNGVVVHQYCLYFASGLEQRGEESEGIHGFLFSDIRSELRRASKLRCKFCHKKGAPTGCSVGTCRQMGHIPCLLGKGFLLHHFNNFQAYCQRHRPAQPLPPSAVAGDKACCICLGRVQPMRGGVEVLFCPNCETPFHRSCLQKLAWTAGRNSFRCSLCANKTEFLQEMLRMGLEVPERDVNWESDGYSSRQVGEQKICQGPVCFCPDGRSFFTTLSKYRMKTCQSCGRNLGHLVCVKGSTCDSCQQLPHAQTLQTDTQLGNSLHVQSQIVSTDTSKVGVAEVGVARADSVSAICDCPICQARASTPDSLSSECLSSDLHSLDRVPSSPPSTSHPSSVPSRTLPPPSATQLKLVSSTSSTLPNSPPPSSPSSAVSSTSLNSQRRQLPPSSLNMLSKSTPIFKPSSSFSSRKRATLQHVLLKTPQVLVQRLPPSPSLAKALKRYTHSVIPPLNCE